MGHENIVQSVCISNDSKLIISGSQDNSIKVWDIESKAIIKSFTGHEKRVYSVCITNDTKFIVSGSEDNTINVWEFEFCFNPNIFF